MRPDIEQSLLIEFEELFSLPDRIRTLADAVRALLLSAGFQEPLQTDVFDQELELRGTEHTGLLVRLDSYHLEVTGAPPELQTHALAALLLNEAGVFRLTMVEAGLTLTVKARRGQPLSWVDQAFSTLGEEPMLDRRFSMTWDWGTATTGYSFHASDTEDREIHLSFKAREGYLTLPELQDGGWMATHRQRFDGLVVRFFAQLGWEN